MDKSNSPNNLAFVHYSSTEESASTKNVMMTVEALSKELNVKLFSTVSKDKVIDIFDISEGFGYKKNGLGISMKAFQVLERVIFSFITIFQILISDLDKVYTRDIIFLFMVNFVPTKEIDIIYEAHNPYNNTSRFPEIIEKLALRTVDHTFCVSEGVERDLSKWVENISILRNCVRWSDFENLKNLDTGSETLVLYSGSLKPRKGVDTLLDAFEFLGEDYKLKILGSRGSDSLINRIEDNQKIVNLGFVDNESVVENLGKADILVHPSKNTLYQRKYTSPMKLFEYMASGTSVISSDLPTSRWIAGETINYFPAEKPKHLSERIEKLSKNLDSDEKVEKARERVENNHTYGKKASTILQKFSEMD